MIRFEDVGFAYDAGGSPAGGTVRNLSFAVPEGSCTLICGPSGCGKTTATRIANGLAPAFFPGRLTGRVLVDGRDGGEMESWEMAASVGSVFQNPRTQFFNVDSTGEVAFSLESLAWPEDVLRARTAEVMEELGIRHLADRSIFSLSGGEKQRVAFASAWAPHPANLVLDEPTSNLDLDAIEALRRYILAAKSQGCSVLIAEHRLWWLAEVVDEVLVMEDGSVARRLTGSEFRSLPPAVLRKMGLRTRDLLHVCASKPDSRRASGSRGPGDPVLKANALCADQGKRRVLRNIDLELLSGEVVALVGPNGSGKTTLCRTLAGLHKESGGDVRVAKERCSLAPAKSKDRLRKAAMVFQDVNFQLFADSVRTEVTFGLPEGSVPDDRVCGLLLQLGLDGLEERHPATLSGGQKQRLAVATCLAAAKSLVVFDEPTSGLDLESMEAVGTLVREVAATGAAVLVVTHDLEFVAGSCDRVVRLEDGVACGECPASDLGEVRRLMSSTASPESDDRTHLNADWPQETRREEGTATPR